MGAVVTLTVLSNNTFSIGISDTNARAVNNAYRVLKRIFKTTCFLNFLIKGNN